MITSISAVTLATHDMARALRFYNTAGFSVIYGDADADFTSLRAGDNQFLNLIAQPHGRRGGAARIQREHRVRWSRVKRRRASPPARRK